MEPKHRVERSRLSRVPARWTSVLGILPSLALLACVAGTEHSVEPYRSSKAKAFLLSKRAAVQCFLSGANGMIHPVRPFATDGCSGFPDAEWNLSCCVEHDIAYWCGGDAAARREADEEFGRCIEENSNEFMGWLMETGVRVGGHPIFPTSYRWGYGHPYRMTYPSAVADD